MTNFDEAYNPAAASGMETPGPIYDGIAPQRNAELQTVKLAFKRNAKKVAYIIGAGTALSAFVALMTGHMPGLAQAFVKALLIQAPLLAGLYYKNSKIAGWVLMVLVAGGVPLSVAAMIMFADLFQIIPIFLSGCGAYLIWLMIGQVRKIKAMEAA